MNILEIFVFSSLGTAWLLVEKDEHTQSGKQPRDQDPLT